MSIIRFDDVSYHYTNQVPALSNISLRIQKGEVVGIMGRNGAGKSTLIQLINGLLKPTKGTIYVNNISTVEFDPRELLQKIGVMFQNPDHQLFSSSVEEELDFSLKNLRISATQKAEYKEDIIQDLSLQPLLDKSPWNCSGGERKKISIASILCRKPDVLIFDEPTLGQDKHGYKILEEILSDAIQKAKTIIVVTHNTEFALKYMKRIVILEQGKILADGPVDEILTNMFIQENSAIIEPQFHKLKRILTQNLAQDSEMTHNLSRAKSYQDLEIMIKEYGRGI